MQRYRLILFIGFSILLSFSSITWSKNSAADYPLIEFPFEKFTLSNGLTVIIHEDHKAPIIAVSIWYHVGSKDEQLGKTGFAHLFEHLMFNGSENFNDEFFIPLEKAGATDMNGTTNNDRTNYFQTIPTSALDLTLWMESDRMGHLLGAITQDKLDEQRGVVKNEKRQGENQPYGKVWQTVAKNTFPTGHPYSWSVIGSMEDLNNASLEDVHQWFTEYYGAANALVVLSGDIDLATAKQKVQHYFGDIAPGKPLAKQKSWIAKRSGSHRQVMYDQVPRSRIYKVWNVPGITHPEADQLDLTTSLLASGKNSRLYKRLVYDEQIATSVSAFYYGREIAGQVWISADAKPGVELATLEAAIDDELARFIAKGPTQKELDRVKTGIFSDSVRVLEKVGGYGGKSEQLAYGEVYFNKPDVLIDSLDSIRRVKRKTLREVSKTWLSDGEYVLAVKPFDKYSRSPNHADRSEIPAMGPSPQFVLPKFQRTQLSNGLNILLAERHHLPTVEFEMQFDGGFAADQFGKLGSASLTLSMLKEGTQKLSALEISNQAELLGAHVSTHSSLDTSSISLSALKTKLDPSLSLYADIILNPKFSEEDLERKRQLRLAAIASEQARPISMALRLLPPLIYGSDHAYGIPFTGSGTTDSVKSINQADLKHFHSQWIRPDNATLIITGDTTLAEIIPKLEQRFGNWQPPQKPILQKNLAIVPLQKQSQVYLIDQPGALQATLIAGHIAPSSQVENNIAIQLMNTIIGGSFTSRLNLNLREDKHWSYGAGSVVSGAFAQRPFFTYAAVQIDKTAESIQEILKEFNRYLGDSPATQEELEKVVASKTLKLPGQYETNSALLGGLSGITRFHRPDDYINTYSEKLSAIELNTIHQATQQVLHPNQFIWVIIGDLEKIQTPISKLGLGEIIVLDKEGKVVPSN